MQQLTPLTKILATKPVLFCKRLPLFSFPTLLALDFDISILFIVFLLIGIVTFLAGTAYGIYLNDKISEKQASNHLSRS